MLELLMEGRSVPKPNAIGKKKIPSHNEKSQEQLELEINRLQDELKATKKDLEYLLQNVEVKGYRFWRGLSKTEYPPNRI